MLMTDVTIATPAAAEPAPRFTLTADPARGVHMDLAAAPAIPIVVGTNCMAEE